MVVLFRVVTLVIVCENTVSNYQNDLDNRYDNEDCVQLSLIKVSVFDHALESYTRNEVGDRECPENKENCEQVNAVE